MTCHVSDCRAEGSPSGWILAGPGSASWGAGLVLLAHAGRDPAAVADCDAVRFGPGADVAAVLPAGRGAGSPPGRSPASLAGVLDERRELPAEAAGILG